MLNKILAVDAAVNGGEVVAGVASDVGDFRYFESVGGGGGGAAAGGDDAENLTKKILVKYKQTNYLQVIVLKKFSITFWR